MKKLSFYLGRICVFLLFYLLLCPLFPSEVRAGGVSIFQEVVTGKVLDTEGTPLAGVNIVVESKNIGTMSGQDGSFSIQASPTDVLVLSMIGFKSLTVPIGGRDEVSVSMAEDVMALGEVVLNAGYYTVSEKERTGSIEKVSALDIEKQPISNPLAALQGRMAGVEIEQTSGLSGSNFIIRIRGRNSIRSGGADPLYVIDGVPYSNTTIGDQNTAGALLGSGISPLNNINPNDIESIEVLKDADATAIYGSRGANGVVLITTKKGRPGKTRVEFNVVSGLGKVSRTMDVLGTEAYLAMRREAYANDGISDYPANAYDVNGTWDNFRETDWQKEFYGRTSYLTSVQGTVSGGSERTRFLVSGTYYGQTNVLPKDYRNDKVSGLLNLSHKSENDHLSLQLSTQFTSNQNNLPGDTQLVRQGYSLAPNAPKLYNEDGSLNWENSTWINPLARLERDYVSNASTLISNVKLDYRIVSPLSFSVNAGYTENHLKEINTTPSTIYDPVYGAGAQYSSVFHNTGKRTSYIVEPQFHFNHDLGVFKVSALGGLSFQERNSSRLAIRASGFSDNSLLENIAAASDIFPYASMDNQYRYQAVFGRVNLSHRNKYILNLTGRRDGSSRFGTDKRFANFWAIGMAWLFSEEGFVSKALPFLSHGKIRGSYGTSGNDQIGDYEYLDTYSFGTGHYQNIIGIYPTRLYNPDYSWEENRKIELGMELGLFEDRISLEGQFYNNRSSNQLVGIPLPATTGFGSVNANLDATVENQGWEMGLHSININNNTWRWTTSFNLTVPRNKLVSFPGLEGSTYANQLVLGEPLGILKMYELKGVNQETGLFEFVDFNGDGVISALEDKQVLVDLSPQYYGGLGNRLDYKGFSFDFLLQFTKQKGLGFLSYAPIVGGMTNQPVEVLDRWQQPGDTAKFQRFSTGTDITARHAFSQYAESDGVVSDASYIRLQNVSLSYRFEDNDHKGFGCEVFLRGQNLWTWTDYFGLDPVSLNKQTVPTLRFVTLGTRITF